MINQLCIIGLGLIGGSLARALRQAGAVDRVVATGHREASLACGKEMGIIDDYSLNLADVVTGSDMVMIGTPTLVAEQTLADLAPMLTDDMVITDGASVKGNLWAAAQRIWQDAPDGVPGNIVFGHPIAGSEQSGVEASRADLYEHHKVILTPHPSTHEVAKNRVRRMWEAAGATVVEMDIARHDHVLAATSHLPHVLAYALVDALAADGDAEDIFQFAAGGFKDFTRIASSHPKMWHDITLANSAAILHELDQFTDRLAVLRAAIANGDGEKIMQTFAHAKQARDEHFLPHYKGGR